MYKPENVQGEGPDHEFLNQLTFEPLTKSNWGKFPDLFGENVACGNGWFTGSAFSNCSNGQDLKLLTEHLKIIRQ